MRKLILLSFLLFLMIVITGCSSDNSVGEKQPVKINMPKDNTVNGYLTSEAGSGNTQITTDTISVSENTQSYSYWGNKNSKKFHKAGCSSFKNTKDENKVFYESRDEFVSYGFQACKICNP